MVLVVNHNFIRNSYSSNMCRKLLLSFMVQELMPADLDVSQDVAASVVRCPLCALSANCSPSLSMGFCFPLYYVGVLGQH